MLSFVEEVTKLLQGNLGREQLHILSNAGKDESSVGMRHRGMPKRIFLRMSEKYPVEGCNVLLSALAAVNSKSQNAYVTYSCTALSKENIENENDSSSKPEEINSNVDEITILNPIWLFDSIANYSLATIA